MPPSRWWPIWHTGRRLKHARAWSPKTGWGRLYCYYKSKVRPGYSPWRGYAGPWCPTCNRPSDRVHRMDDWLWMRAYDAKREARREVAKERERLERWRLGRMTPAERKARKAFLRDLRLRRERRPGAVR